MAERSISTRLTLKIANFLAGADGAKRALGDLNRKFTETAGFAAGFRKKLDDAFKRLPKIEIDANSTPAEVKIAEVRSRLEQLRDKKVGVDIDAGAALAEMHMIQRELASIDDRDVSFDVKAGISGAMAELAAVDAEISRLDGRDAQVRVHADISGAMSGIATVGAALAALAATPAIVSIGAAGLALGSAFGAAGAGALGMAAVAVPALGRVNEALKQQESSAGGAGGAVKSLAQKQAEAAAAALRLAQAQERVRKANESVKDAARGVVQAQQDVKRAQDAVAQASADGAARVADAVRRVSDAERQYSDAVRASKDAQEGLNDARRQAVRDLEDLGNRLTDTKLDQRQAALDLADAEKALNKVKGNKNSSAADIERATIAYERAQQRVKELATSVERLTADKAEADAKGVEGSDVVKSAQDRLADANQRVADSQKAIADAQANVAKAQTEAAQSVAAAQDRVASAQEKLIDAQRRYSDAQRDAIMAERQLKLEKLQQKAATEQAGAAAGGAASKMAELTVEEQKLAKAIKGFQDEYQAWQQGLEGDVFPAIVGGLDLVKAGLPKIAPLVKTAAKSFVNLEKDAKKALEGPFWDRFIWDLNTYMPGAIQNLGRTTGNVFAGMAGVVDAFLPHSAAVTQSIEDASKRFAEWGQNLKDSPGFKAFIAYVAEQGPKVKEILSNVAEAVGKIFQAGLDVGPGALDILVAVSQKLSELSPDQIKAIATGVGLIFAALKIGQTLKITALLGLAEVIGKLPPPVLYAVAGGIAAVVLAVKGVQALKSVTQWWGDMRGKISDIGEAASSAKSKVSGLGEKVGGLGEKLGGLSTVVGGAALTGGLMVLESRFADAATAADRYAGKVLAAAGSDLDSQIAAVSRELKKQNDLQGPNIANWIYFTYAGKEAGDRAATLQDKLDELNYQKELATIQAGKTGDAYTTMGGKIDGATDAVKGLDKSLDTFTARTDVAAALQNLTKDYKDVKQAIDEANGKLDVNAGKTDAQKNAIIRAREKFAGYLTDLRNAADAQKGLSGKTFDSTKTIVEQLPKLFDLAGKNKEARTQVLLLAEAYGISREDAIKAAKGGKDLKEVLDKLKSKSVRIDANTKPAEGAFQSFLNTINNKVASLTITAEVRYQQAKKTEAARNSADGNIFMADGGITRFANGSEKHVAQIAMPGTRIWAEPETQGEAYIPLAQSKRPRSLAILDQVAEMFGKAVVPATAAPTRSAPVQSRPRVRSAPIQIGGRGSSGPVIDGRVIERLEKALASRPALNIESMPVYETADVDVVLARASMKMGARG
ncbi:hypothetical protein IMZ11_02295 [Microtetraspora sp. AC03309]|uniref:hypothetical protein n=1 Tax=Microtetraspora sp. AC03309 TaxID=2779376 RepID=UPI001E49B081|nr:hypothetical protein [Microtetraspora sp. AC03309]MCC5574471.1 hypothetical protein [Microtetraspora sp. AC03309]